MFGFYPWECLSLVTVNGTTLDFVITDSNKMMALLAILSRTIYNLEADKDFNDLMRIYLQLKFKMKLSYECYRKKVKLEEVIIRGIKKTVKERCNLAITDLQEFFDRVSDDDSSSHDQE